MLLVTLLASVFLPSVGDVSASDQCAEEERAPPPPVHISAPQTGHLIPTNTARAAHTLRLYLTHLFHTAWNIRDKTHSSPELLSNEYVLFFKTSVYVK